MTDLLAPARRRNISLRRAVEDVVACRSCNADKFYALLELGLTTKTITRILQT